MDIKQRQGSKGSWYHIMIGFVSFIMLFIIKSVTTVRLSGFDGGDIPTQVFYAWAILGILLIYNSIVHTLTLYDEQSLLRFQARKVEKVRLWKELSFIIGTTSFWLQTLPVVALSMLVASLGGFFEVGYAIFEVGKAPIWANRLLPLFTIPPLLFLVSLLCRYEIHRYYAQLIRSGEERRIQSRVKLALKIILIILIYPLIFPYTPYVIFFILTFVGIVGALVSTLSILGFIAALCGIIFLIYGLSKLKTRRLVRKFLHSVTETAKIKGEKVEIFSKEESKVRGYNLTLTSGGKEFCVKIITAMNRFTPLSFNSANDACFLHRIGTKEHNTTLEKHFEYAFYGEGQRIIVIIKYPRRIFASEHGATRKLYSGDKIWNYIIFNSESFLGAQDRECLYRSNDENR